MKQYYEIAGVRICVSGNDQEMYTDERLLTYFKVNSSETEDTVTAEEDEFRFDFSIQGKLPETTGTCVFQDPSRRIYIDGEREIRYIGSVKEDVSHAYLCTERNGRDILVHALKSRISNRFTVKTVLNSLAMERLALEGDGVVLHASYVVWNGRAILFTAPSGTGKSTQAKLWSELRGAEIINGDRAVIRRANGLIFSCGLPFAGSSEYCKNVTAPLMTVVYLGQSNDTQIQKLSGGMAFRRVWEGCSVASWCSEDVEKAMSIVQDVTAHVPVYYLNCTPDESAVAALENELRKGDK